MSFLSQHTWGLVVANSEVWGNTAARVSETRSRAVGSEAANFGSARPDDLGEVTPKLELAHVWVLTAILSREEWLLAVVEQVGNDSGDVVSRHTSSDVLTIATAIHLTTTS